MEGTIVVFGLVLLLSGVLLLLRTLEVIDEVTVHQVGAMLLIGFGLLLMLPRRHRRRWLWVGWYGRPRRYLRD